MKIETILHEKWPKFDDLHPLQRAALSVASMISLDDENSIKLNRRLFRAISASIQLYMVETCRSEIFPNSGFSTKDKQEPSRRFFDAMSELVNAFDKIPQDHYYFVDYLLRRSSLADNGIHVLISEMREILKSGGERAASLRRNQAGRPPNSRLTSVADGIIDDWSEYSGRPAGWSRRNGSILEYLRKMREAYIQWTRPPNDPPMVKLSVKVRKEEDKRRMRILMASCVLDDHIWRSINNSIDIALRTRKHQLQDLNNAENNTY